MINRSKLVLSSREVIFQVVLHALVFVFFAISRHHSQIAFYEVAFFLNYTFAALIINYFLLPRFFYKKEYLSFFLCLLLIISVAIGIEEFVLEQIFFPDTKGKHFSGIFYSLIDVLPVISILSGFKFAWDALRKQREVDELRSTVQESELQFLKSQINPHFLFNNLHNLYSYAIENSPKTPEIILELSGVLRYMLYECKEKYVPLIKEVNQLQNFINLNELQIEERGQVHFSKQNITGSYQIAPLILIVFIENAFKHSTASQSEEISIAIDLQLMDTGVLYFHCKNSFQELSNTDSLSQGIGLENVKKRLQLLYPDAHQLEIIKTADQYEVRLSLDLHQIA